MNPLFEVTRIIDGDTAEGYFVWVPFEIKVKATVRLLNVDTPERGATHFHKAKECFEGLVKQEADRLGRIECWVTKKDSFGRWLTWLNGVNCVLSSVWPYKPTT